MILVIPTVYIKKGRSVYSIGGLDGLEKYSDQLKESPLNLIQLLREENNKTLLIHSDNSTESMELIKSIIDLLDIPIQVYLHTDNSDEFIQSMSKIRILRIFSDFQKINYVSAIFPNAIPVFKITEYSQEINNEFDRIMIDAEGKNLGDVLINTDKKVSVINAMSNTELLTKLNLSKSPIDSIYLGKEYYGINYVGQLLWRIAELEQLSR